MASVKVVLRKKKNSKGEYPLVIRITKDRKTSYIYTGKYILEDQWDYANQRVKKIHPNSKRLNNFLLKKLAEVNDEFLKLESENKLQSAKGFNKQLKQKHLEDSFFILANTHLNYLEKTGKITRVKAERSRVNHFKYFLDGNDISFKNITEDLLSTLCLLTVNYRTVYLNEKLSQGMAADSVEGYFIQRSRWCRGGIQCFFVPEGPLRAKGLTILQRILFAPYGWIMQPLTRIILLLVPIVYLWTGLLPLYFTSTRELLAYQIPMLLAFAFAMQWLAKRKYVPIISTSIGVFSMFRLLPVVISSLIKPFGEPFRVTPKGSSSSSSVDWGVFTVTSILLILTVGGIVINLVPEHQIISSKQFFPYALFWSSLNVVMLLICVLICFDAPRRRKEERFIINEAIEFNDMPMLIEDISISGCKIKHSANKRVIEQGTVIKIKIPDINEKIKMLVKNSNATCFTCIFQNLSLVQREELIAKLFTGRYNNEIYETAFWSKIIKSLLKRALGEELE
jgi:cellulose synthase (UDP-forming)